MSNKPSDGTGAHKNPGAAGSGIYKAEAAFGTSGAATNSGPQTDIRKIARALIGRRERARINYRIYWY
jgi:hypothetical protein